MNAKYSDIDEEEIEKMIKDIRYRVVRASVEYTYIHDYVMIIRYNLKNHCQ